MSGGKLYGLIGRNVENSLSPVIHNALFKRYGIDAFYTKISSDSIGNAMKKVKELDFKGINITMPYKEQVISYLDELRGDAEIIRVVNTVKNEDGRFVGYNTDGIGALKALKRFTNLIGKKVLILGGGGAGKSIAYSLSKLAEVTVLDRKESRIKEVEKIGVKGGLLNRENLRNLIEEVDILINATPVGMKGDESLVPGEFLREDMVVMDIVYAPLQTRLLKDSIERGCITVDGLWMLVEQAAESFRIWTGMEGDSIFMRKVAMEALK